MDVIKESAISFCNFEFYVSHETRAPHLLLEMFTGHFCGAAVSLHVQRYGTNRRVEKTGLFCLYQRRDIGFGNGALLGVIGKGKASIAS